MSARIEVWAITRPDGATGAILARFGRSLCSEPFDSVEDAEAFLAWRGDGGWWNANHLERELKEWRIERGWARCPNHADPDHPCHGRVRPGANQCDDCASDEWAAQQQGVTE